MDEVPAEKVKARRDLRILLICAVVGVAVPLAFFCVRHVSLGS